jgi:peptidoglycan lytic transglycosylase B
MQPILSRSSRSDRCFSPNILCRLIQCLFLASVLVSAPFVTGCASGASTQPPRTVRSVSAGAASHSVSVRKPMLVYEQQAMSVGGYAAPAVYGSYAGYPELERFIDNMVSRHGFSRRYLNGLFSQAKRKPWTLNYMGRTRKKSGRPRPGGWSRYRAKFLTKKHISRGAAYWGRYALALQRASVRYGVPSEYIMGIMGVETIYGGNVGNHRVIDALTTLAFDLPRRATYFRGELESFLLMARDERIDPTQPIGSFAGAMGLGQFMPTSFRRWAVDFDGDGRRDLWNPVDAIGSIANYFAQYGWRPGDRVVTRALANGAGAKTLESGFDTHYSLRTLAQHGIYPAEPHHGSNPVRLLRLSTYHGDEYWLGHRNFYVITRYNHSTYYAMAVHQLAQAVKQRYLRTVAMGR